MGIHSILSHLFYPNLCLGCGGDSLNDGEFICFKCYAELPYTHFNIHRNNKTERVFYGRTRITHAMSLLYFSKNAVVQNLMHELKYKGQKELGIHLGRMMGKAINESECFSDIDYLVPLPLSERKKRQRGYNQSEMLCIGISEVIEKPVLNNTVLRTVHTSTQTRKHRRERWKNVEGIFEIREGEKLNGKHILLVDDVITTGATLEACAEVVLQGVDTRVSVATLAIAVK